MLSVIEGFGEKVANFFGEPNICGKIRGRERLLESLYDQEAFVQLLPYEAFDERSGIFLQENSLGFVLEIEPLVGGDQTVERMIHSLYSELLDEGASLQVLLWADPRIGSVLKRWVKARSNREILKKIAEKRALFLQENPKVVARIFRLILSYSKPRSHNEEDDRKSLVETKERVVQTLTSVSSCYAWNPEDLIEHVLGFSYPAKSKDFEEQAWNPLQSLSSQMMCGGSLTVEKNRLAIETDMETHFRGFRTIQTPAQFEIGAMGNLIGDVLHDNFRIRYPFYIQYGVHKPKQDAAQGKFWRRTQNIENQGRSSALVRMIPKLADELSECDYVRRALDRGESIVHTSLTAGVWAPKDELARASQELQSVFKINQFKLVENTHLQLPTFLWSLPMTWAESTQTMTAFSLLKTTLDSECAYFAPMQGEWSGTSSPGMVMLGRRGQLMRWSPFDSAGGNFNVVVVGRSGAGKSVFMQDLLVSGISTGAKVYVLDVGRSFERVCDLLDGQKIEFSRNTEICLNPFSDIQVNTPEDREDAINCLKSVIACMAAPQSGTDDFQLSLIEHAIVEVWNVKGPNATVTDVAEWLLRQQDEVARRLGITLTPYTKHGSYGKYFEGKNNVNFTNPMVLIELEELKEKKDLQTVVLQIFMLNITQQAFMGDRKSRCYICIDEAWDLLRAKQTELFIETLARRIRKYGGSLIVGTQNISDFFSAPGANAAFKNAEWTCILAQKKSAVQEAIESGQFPAPEQMHRAIDTLVTKAGEYAEVMICDSAQNYSIERLVLDPFSQLLYTTKAEEFARINELKKQGYSVAEAVEKMAGERP